MATSEESKAAAQAVKTEANSLFQSRKFKEAHAKYGEAIALDDTNAVLFANRAACSLELQQYLDAATDARKATVLDPGYAKAWARLGKAFQALRAFDRSIEAWESALKCYSGSPTLTTTEKQLKASCEAGLREAKKDLRELGKPTKADITEIDQSVIDRGMLPWQIAERMVVDISKIGQSSAWVILNARREFSSGCEKMKKTVETDTTFSGPLGVIMELSNGLMRDPRAFAADSSDWIELYNRQMRMEMQYFGGWPSLGPVEVQNVALKMQKEQGFTPARKALVITVRSWFMRGFLEQYGGKEYKLAMQFYRSAIEVLEWGREVWRDVPDSERGSIFASTFVRSVRRYYLNALFEACRHANFSADTGLDYDKLDTMAEEQVRETNENLPQGDEDFLRDPGFYGSFFLYPVADALAIRGAIAMDKAMKCKDTNVELANDYFAQEKKHYMAAANLLPKDEEFRLLYLKRVLEAVWYRGDAMGECIAWAQFIASARPAVSKIWKYSAFSSALNIHLAQVRSFEEKACLGIVEGDFFAHSPATLINLPEC